MSEESEDKNAGGGDRATKKPDRRPDFKGNKMVCPVCGYKLDSNLPFALMEYHMREKHQEWLEKVSE